MAVRTGRSEPAGPAEASAAVRFGIDGAVATVTLCRPETRNAQTPKLWAALCAFAAGLPQEVRVVVVRAEGESFSAGLDLAMFSPDATEGDLSFRQLLELDDAALTEQIATFQGAFTWQRRPELTTVAAVKGHAVGAGFQLALACDLRVVADDARFCMRETSLGLVPDLGGTAPLVEAVGYSRALEICLTGRWVDAHEALQLGLVTVVVPRAELDDAVSDLVAAVTAAPHAAVTVTKGLLQEAPYCTPEEQLAAERLAQVRRLRDLAAQLAGNNGE